MRQYFFMAALIILVSMLTISCGDDPAQPESGSGEELTREEIDQINADSDFEPFDYSEDVYALEDDYFDETPLLQTVLEGSNTPSHTMVDRVEYILGNLQETQYVHYKDHVMNESKGI